MRQIHTLISGRPRLYTFVLGIGVGASVCLGVMNFHILRARDGFYLVQKHHAKLAQTYVDTRQFNARDWAENVDLTASLAADNKEYLMTQELVKTPRR
ncbi:MAG: hypothetical protein M3N48_04495 [Verrucomicrobiota bacterium]|nr:hypothetical protein [Verrucomicrobiota bacterium]